MKSKPEKMEENIWKKCWEQDMWFDFTQPCWQVLSTQEKINKAQAYQEWYACKNNVATKQSIETEDTAIAVKLIPPGRFSMGASKEEQQKYSWNEEEYENVVTIEKPFWLAITPVTQQQWEKVMQSCPSYFSCAGDNAPIENISWYESNNFCKKIGACLPTEKQWEYACRAGTTGMSYIGDFSIKEYCNAPILGEIAWYGGNSEAHYDGSWLTDDWHEQEINSNSSGIQKVAQKKPNAWGLYDMIGNVWEWCDSVYQNNADLSNKSQRTSYVLKGASWFDSARNCRSANRYYYTANHRSGMIGFRVCFEFEKNIIFLPY